MHYTIASGGDVPNVVAEYAKVWLWLRDWKRAEVEDLLARVRMLAERRGQMTETAATVTVQRRQLGDARQRGGRAACCTTT